MDLDNDKQLITNFLAGDDSAFRFLVEKYLKSVYNFLYSFTKDPAVLDDLTQETFIKAWKNIKKFDSEKNFKTWVFTIAKNTALDYCKKKKNIPFSFFTNKEGNNKLEEIDDDKILPDEILEKKDLAKDLERKLDNIPENYRLILLLRYRDDFTLEEIAEILDRPYNTIKSAHNRALAKLKEELLKKITL